MSFHVYSEDEESPTNPDPSPRTELLSPSSPTREEPDRRSRRSQRSQRGPSERFRRQREEAYASVSARQLLSLLVEKEYEASKLRKGLHRAFDRVEGEAQRVAEAERVTQETLNHFRAVNEGRIAAERALAKTHEELGLWKFQFEHVQRELARAQDVVKLLERQLEDAEESGCQGARGCETAERAAGGQETWVPDWLSPGARGQGDLEIEDSGSYSYSYTAPQRGRNELGLGGSVSQLLRDVNTSPVLRMPQMPPTHSHPAQPPDPPPPLPARQTEYIPRSLPPSLPPSPNIPPSPTSHRRQSSTLRRNHNHNGAVVLRRLDNNRNRKTIMLIRPRPVHLLMHHHPSQNSSISSHYIYITVPPPQFSQQHAEPNNLNDTNGPAHRRPVSLAPSASASAAHRPVSQTPTTPRLLRAGPARSRSTSTSSPATRSTTPCRTTISPWRGTGAITLPPPWQLSPAMSEAALPQSGYGSRRGRRRGRSRGITGTAVGSMGSRAGRARRMGMGMGRHKGKGKARRSRGSVTGRSNAGSTAGRHTRQASLDSRLAARKLAGGGEYAPDLRAIREVDASPGGQSQRARSMRVPSAESLVPPPVPAKDRKQIIADELRYSDPDLPDSWRREGAADVSLLPLLC
ncbi:hypothetical protein B0H14DRAFT_2858336 [Mycena olivaceomarginata]|nr:hypothetical protein B0H14DRAFT_2858336 [Mycena olivaceomarginata]